MQVFRTGLSLKMIGELCILAITKVCWSSMEIAGSFMNYLPGI